MLVVINLLLSVFLYSFDDQAGFTVLHVAVQGGHIDVIETLIRHGAIVNHATKVSQCDCYDILVRHFHCLLAITQSV